ncbi:hypothetical protein [Clavibacter sp. B3I6]|uniref:hypothetical protein n=1 Tax=Clavibacter sp. B3I6 TaxID=3042268 RepID=UPI0027D81485|nr:hypothetical protein [Clavibacter sp. B3I6]
MTLVASVVLWPVGGVLILANAAGALMGRGTTRNLFAAIAIAGAVGFTSVVLFGFAVSTGQEVTVVRQ